MENNPKNLSMLSAYNRVCQKFIEACEAEKLDPVEGVLAIGRFLGLNINQGSFPDKPSQSTSTSTTTPERKLSKEEVEAVKKSAKEAKAKKLGISSKEVNLTPQEVKSAKAEARKRVQRGEGILPQGFVKPVSSSPPVNGKSTPKEEGQTSNSKRVPKPDRSQPSEKTGLRATALTKLKACRKLCLQTVPTALIEPKVLHLLAYSNHYNRLVSQWAEFQKSYETYGLQNPLRGLLNPGALKATHHFLQKVIVGLKEQPDSPGTYILQLDGRSFWDRDKPSEICPYDLKQDLPGEILDEFKITENHN